ncbi:hypothetical protein GCM10020216_039490 [Nonomuraea helvata]
MKKPTFDASYDAAQSKLTRQAAQGYQNQVKEAAKHEAPTKGTVRQAGNGRRGGRQ